MAVLNTSLGYRAPRTPGMSAPKPVSPVPTQGLSRALTGVGQSYVNPYAGGTNQVDSLTGLSSGPIQTPNLPTTPAAPAGVPQTYTQQAAPASTGSAYGYSFDLTTDPVLQQIMAAADRQRADAQAGALAQQKQLAIQYGDANYGNTIDPNTGAAAQGNTFGVYQNLARQYQTGSHNLDENLNAHNLFYSGERINELAQALQDYQQQQANAAGAEQAGLGNINANQIAAMMGADQNVQQGYSDAYGRALNYALQQALMAAQQQSGGDVWGQPLGPQGQLSGTTPLDTPTDVYGNPLGPGGTFGPGQAAPNNLKPFALPRVAAAKPVGG